MKLAIFILIYFLIFGVMTSLRHYNFQTQTWDMAAFVQAIWNTTQGRIMQTSLEEVSNHFGVHMSPFLFLLVPGYLLFPSPYFLLIIQTLILALGAWPLYLLSKKILGDKNTALLISGVYLLYPSLHWMNWFDFHPIVFLPTFLITAFYFIETGRWLWASLFLILGAATQEDAILAVMFLGIFLIFYKRKEFGIARGSVLAFACLIYFIVSIQFIMPAFGGGLLRIDRYQHLGKTPLEILQNILLNPKIVFDTVFSSEKFLYLFWLFLPIAFLPFYSGYAFLLLIPGLLENLLTDFKFQFSSLYQYDAVLAGGIFIAVIFALKKLFEKWPEKKKIFSGILLAASLLGFFFRSPLNPASFPLELFQENEHWAAFREMLKVVPSEASVAAHTNLVPHLAERERVYMFGYEPVLAEIVLADGADYFGFSSPKKFMEHFEKYLKTGEYRLEVLRERYFILIHKKYVN